MARRGKVISVQIDEPGEKTLESLTWGGLLSKSQVIRQMLCWQQFTLDVWLQQQRMRRMLEQKKLVNEDDFERLRH